MGYDEEECFVCYCRGRGNNHLGSRWESYRQDICVECVERLELDVHGRSETVLSESRTRDGNCYFCQRDIDNELRGYVITYCGCADDQIINSMEHLECHFCHEEFGDIRDYDHYVYSFCTECFGQTSFQDDNYMFDEQFTCDGCNRPDQEGYCGIVYCGCHQKE